jgi:hypothetical protein
MRCTGGESVITRDATVDMPETCFGVKGPLLDWKPLYFYTEKRVLGDSVLDETALVKET